MKKTLIISGRTGGLGTVITKYFTAKGYNVVEDPVFHHKLQDFDSVKIAIEKAVAEYGSIDACIHCAVSPIIRKDVINFEPEEFRSQFEVGFFGGFNLFKVIAPIMQKQKFGSIIGITTTAIEEPSPNMGAYIVSKIALRGLLRELARELKPSGVRVNAIAPGLMITKLNSDLSDKAMQIMQEKYPDEITNPKDVAEIAYSICSQKSQTSKSFSVLGEPIDL